MRRRFTYLLLSLCIVAGSGQAFADHNNHRGGKDRQEQSGHRPGGNSGNRPGGNSGNKNNGKHDNKNHDWKHDDKRNDKFIGNQNRPGNNTKPGNNWDQGNNMKPGNNHRPGNVGQPANNHRPGGAGHDNFRPGPSSAPRPGTGGHVVAPAPHPVAPPHPAPHPAPVVRPGGGYHYGPALPPPPPRLPYMVELVTQGARDWNVWQVDAETFIVKYRRGGRWYTQYLYPYAERYGNPNVISVNWQPLSPWTLIPPIQLNINL